MWDLITSKYRDHHEWVIKADTDTYINGWVVAAQFDRGLFDTALHHTMPRYVGISGVGRSADLGLKAPCRFQTCNPNTPWGQHPCLQAELEGCQKLKFYCNYV